ncbi:MAG: hypothetical protein KAR06_01440, partial [Deltaproteobacteria bacterium]|nr:hypothetical protein [Deltaproteobacteria bacterium]
MKIYNLKFALLIFALAMFVVGCATKQMALDADGFAQRGEWEAAAMKYEELLSEEPDNIGYRTKLTRAKNMAARDRYVKGLELRDSGELKAAFVEFKSAYTLDPTYKRAETDMRKVLRMIESNAEYERGLKFLKQQKRKAALSSFKKALALYSKNEKAAKEVARMVKDKPLVLGGFELNLKSRDPITLKLNNESIKKIFNILTKLSGINFVFDSD